MGQYRNQINFEDAEREQLYAKVAIMGASGSGKTVSALKLAFGLVGGDWSKVFVADTENKRALAYRGTTHTGLEVGKFKHAPISAPYDTEKFMDIIDVAMENGAEVLIIDSISHQWEGLGGVLEENEKLGSDFWEWKLPKKRHHKLKDHIQQVPMHIIVTMRTKQDYAIIPGGGKNGKNAIEKLGMKPVQENAFDYEFILSFHINEDNEANTTKDNTGLFKGEEFRIETDHGQKLRTWLVEGKEVKTVKEDKQELRSRRQELVDQFTKQRKSTPKAEKFFTNQEIKTGKDIKDWDLTMLEALDQQLRLAAEKKKEKPAPTPPPEPENTEPEPEQDPEPEIIEEGTMKKKERAAITKEIKELSAIPEVKDVCKTYLEKMKVKAVSGLSDAQVKTLLSIAQRRAKTSQEKKGA